MCFPWPITELHAECRSYHFNGVTNRTYSLRSTKSPVEQSLGSWELSWEGSWQIRKPPDLIARSASGSNLDFTSSDAQSGVLHMTASLPGRQDVDVDIYMEGWELTWDPSQALLDVLPKPNDNKKENKCSYKTVRILLSKLSKDK